MNTIVSLVNIAAANRKTDAACQPTYPPLAPLEKRDQRGEEKHRAQAIDTTTADPHHALNFGRMQPEQHSRQQRQPWWPNKWRPKM